MHTAALLQTDGAYTGETSLTMLSDYRVNWVLVGHSERRNVFGETSELAGEKARVRAQVVRSAADVALPHTCCPGGSEPAVLPQRRPHGGVLHRRDAGGAGGGQREWPSSLCSSMHCWLTLRSCFPQTLDVCVSQLKPLVEGMPEGGWDRVVIAYEPVWAIGTGKTASPEQAQETHAEIRGWLSANVSEAVASSVRIAYGGKSQLPSPRRTPRVARADAAATTQAPSRPRTRRA